MKDCHVFSSGRREKREKTKNYPSTLHRPLSHDMPRTGKQKTWRHISDTANRHFPPLIDNARTV